MDYNYNVMKQSNMKIPDFKTDIDETYVLE